MTINHEIVLFTLNPDGSLPEFLYFDDNAINCVHPSVNEEGLAPQDHVMIGFTKTPVSDPKPDTIISVLSTKEEVKTYISNNTPADLTIINFEDVTGPEIPVDIDIYTDNVWNTYERLNGIGTTV